MQEVVMRMLTSRGRVSPPIKIAFFRLADDQAKGFCACEGFLLDVTTGLIPFSRTITREFLASEEKPDANFVETTIRAQKEAALLSLRALG
jgi:hypothetical protein